MVWNSRPDVEVSEDLFGEQILNRGLMLATEVLTAGLETYQSQKTIRFINRGRTKW